MLICVYDSFKHYVQCSNIYLANVLTNITMSLYLRCFALKYENQYCGATCLNPCTPQTPPPHTHTPTHTPLHTHTHTGDRGHQSKGEGNGGRSREAKGDARGGWETDDVSQVGYVLCFNFGKQYNTGVSCCSTLTGAPQFPTVEEKMEMDARSVHVGNVSVYMWMEALVV